MVATLMHIVKSLDTKWIEKKISAIVFDFFFRKYSPVLTVDTLCLSNFSSFKLGIFNVNMSRYHLKMCM